MIALATRLAACPIVAILRGIEPREIEGIATELLEAGIQVIEVPLNSPQPFDSIATLARIAGERALIGAGTVLTPQAARDCASAGARMVVAPNSDVAVVTEAKRLGMLALPGFATPTEAFAMLASGADALKLFPSEAFGPAVLRALRAVLPSGVLVLPVGGVDAGNATAWLAAGAAGLGIGSSLYKPGLSAAEVRTRARAIVQAARP